MNWEETAYWVDGLLPGTPSIEVRSGFHIGITTTAAQDNDAATAAASPASGQQSPAGDTIAVTLDFSNIDTGLEHEGRDVRCELLAVAHQADIRSHLVTVASRLRDTAPHEPAQPGTLLPHALPATSTPHVLLVVPWVWNGPVPQLDEPERLTLMLQVLPLTQAEYDYAITYGVPALQESITQQGIDILDLARGNG